MQAITLEVILRAVFGIDDPARRERLGALLVRVLDVVSSPRAQVIGLAARRLGRLGPYGRLQAVLDETDAVLHEQIAERRAATDLGARDDILSLLVAARFEDGEPMSDAEVRDQLVTLLFAGPRDDRDRARVGVRPPVPKPGRHGPPPRRGRRRP